MTLYIPHDNKEKNMDVFNFPRPYETGALLLDLKHTRWRRRRFLAPHVDALQRYLNGPSLVPQYASVFLRPSLSTSSKNAGLFPTTESPRQLRLGRYPPPNFYNVTATSPPKYFSFLVCVPVGPTLENLKYRRSGPVLWYNCCHVSNVTSMIGGPMPKTVKEHVLFPWGPP